MESVFNVLKKYMHLEHTRHRSSLNFFASLASYSTSKLIIPILFFLL
nr:hypothetical protein [Orientia tsutsugamushi]